MILDENQEKKQPVSLVAQLRYHMADNNGSVVRNDINPRKDTVISWAPEEIVVEREYGLD